MADFTWKFCRGFVEYNESPFFLRNNGFQLSDFEKGEEKIFYTGKNFLTDNHNIVVYYNEKQLQQEGLIEKVYNAQVDVQLEKLLKYVEYKKDLFVRYIIKLVYDSEEDIQIEEALIDRFKNSYYINQFIEKNNLRDDFSDFVLNHGYLFNIVEDKDAIRKKLLYDVFNEILETSAYKYIYVYRDFDRKSILISRI